MSERDEYIKKAEARLAQWNAEIDKLQAKMQEAEADAQISSKKRLEEMRNQRDAADAKLNELRQAGDSAWNDMKAGFDKAWDDISGAFESARSRFK